MPDEKFMIGDAVFYIGSKFKDRLAGKKGWIHAPVHNQNDTWVCEFPDTRASKDQKDTDDYVMSASVLSLWRPSPAELKKAEGPDIQPRRSRKNEDE